MKMGMGTNNLRLLLEHHTALRLGGFQVIKRLKGPIGDGLVGQGPQALAGLQFWGIGWQKEQVQSFRHDQLLAGVPPGTIQHQEDMLGWTSSDRLGKVRQG
jgi:hypothetical protein